MGLLDNALQALKSQYEETKGNVGLLMSDPKRYMSGLNQDAAEYNRLSSLALQAERNAYRGIPVSQEQAAAKQYIDQQQQDMALGFVGNIKTVKPNPKLIGTAEQRAAEQGYIDYLHGTQRLDRMLEGKTLNPKRATSGPMPYGTPSQELSSNYAMNKADTSRIANDVGDFKNYFQVAPKDVGSSGRSLMAVEDTWWRLPQSKKNEILDKAKRIGYEDPEQAMGKFVLHETSAGAPFSEMHWTHTLNREAGGNPLKALRQTYAESGMLDAYAPKELADIYKLAGFDAPITQTNAPWSEAKGVFLGKARITNPLQTTDTKNLQENVIPYLKEQFKNDKTRKKQFGADQWDKNTRYTPKEWVEQLEQDVAKGENSYVWTSIPDKVTKTLKEGFGYNGIIDTSGKGGSGTPVPVVIPFEPGQIRSRFAQFDPAKIGEPDLLAGVAPIGLLAAQDQLELKKEKKPKK
jgi:hypothetical protein